MYLPGVHGVSRVLPGRRVHRRGRERALAGAPAAGRAPLVAEVESLEFIGFTIEFIEFIGLLEFIGFIGFIDTTNSINPTNSINLYEGEGYASALRAISGEMGMADGARGPGRPVPFAHHRGEVCQRLGGRAAKFTG